MGGAASRRNLVHAPLFDMQVLGLAAAGAQGATLDQILSLLDFKNAVGYADCYSRIMRNAFIDQSPCGGPRLTCDSSLWADNSAVLKPAFKQIAAAAYKAKVNHLDFKNKPEEARQEINAWIENRTSGIVKSYILPDSVNEHTKLASVSAFYFKGAWADSFNESDIKKKKFYLEDGSPVEVPLMTSSKPQFFSTQDGFQVLKIPYQQGIDKSKRYSMYMFLLNDRKGLWNMTKQILCDIPSACAHVPSQKVDAKGFGVPKFKTSYESAIARTLQTKGVILPFTAEAEFPEIIEKVGPKTPLFLADATQKAFIEVSEEGTEVTVVTVSFLATKRTKPAKPFDYVADHPFLFILREDNSKAELLMGHMLNPSTEY